MAAIQEAKAAKREHEKIAAAAVRPIPLCRGHAQTRPSHRSLEQAAFPFLGIELGVPDEKASKPTGIDGVDLDGKAKPDVIAEALKHKEVPTIPLRPIVVWSLPHIDHCRNLLPYTCCSGVLAV